MITISSHYSIPFSFFIFIGHFGIIPYKLSMPAFRDKSQARVWESGKLNFPVHLKLKSLNIVVRKSGISWKGWSFH